MVPSEGRKTTHIFHFPVDSLGPADLKGEHKTESRNSSTDSSQGLPIALAIRLFLKLINIYGNNGTQRRYMYVNQKGEK